MKLYPLKFDTIFRDKIWGGNKIENYLGKDFSPLPNCGETWEISGVKGNISVVANGELKGKSLVDLIHEFKGDLVGKRVYEKFGCEFPLLIKFIDANDDLSIQVHPDDKLGMARHNSFGKTEMWYVIQADKDANLVAGFKKNSNKEEYVDCLEKGKLFDILNEEQVYADDVFFLPAGRVHSIGKGIMIAEIQQTSDITYRIYDFDRVDGKGNSRELHTEEALEAIDFKAYPEYKTNYKKVKNEAIELVKSDYFQTRRMELTQPIVRNHSAIDSFVITICLKGKLDIKLNSGEIYTMRMGDSFLIPANIKEYCLVPDGESLVLETFVP